MKRKTAVYRLIGITLLLQITACSSWTQSQIEKATVVNNKSAHDRTEQIKNLSSTPTTSLNEYDVSPEYLASDQKIKKNQILIISPKNQRPLKLSDKKLSIKQTSYLDALALNISLIEMKQRELTGTSVERKIAELRKKHPNYSFQPNYIYYLNGKESKGNRRIPQYALDMTGIKLQNKNVGKGIKIALIDTPVDTSHPTLQTASIKKYDYVDTRGKKHGTAIAGILVGNGRIQGVVPSAQLISIGAFNEPQNSKSLGLSTSFVLAKAFNTALKEKVHVINLSFGSTEVDPLMQKLAAKTLANRTILLASVGNDNHQTSVRYPASIKGVYAITAIDAKSKIYKRANTGNPVDYALPGVGILTAKPGGKYTSVTGTSFATAYASGIFALQLSKNADLQQLNKKVLDLGQSGKDSFFGRGLMRF